MTHFIATTCMPPENYAYFEQLLKMPVNVDKSFQEKRNGCTCYDVVYPHVREVKFYEITIREDARAAFERFLCDWFSPAPLGVMQNIAMKKALSGFMGGSTKWTSWKPEFEISNRYNQRNFILAEGQCDIVKRIAECLKCNK